VPLLPLGMADWLSPKGTFAASAVGTFISFFTIGLIRGRLAHRSPWLSAWETVFIGGAAASLAYIVGAIAAG